jgi:uncharacterized membrane protein SpoIIM required for sporulation
MKETHFIAQNKQKWQEAETLLKSEVKDPEKLGSLFTQVVDDLSYARTYYPNRSVRVYLNKIARQYFSIIYARKKERHNQFNLFWTEELPQIIIFSKKELLTSFFIFSLSMLIGIFSSYNDPQFVNTILGDSYVTMTENNIARGDPMAVYKQSHQVDMFLGITLNNLMVAFRTYVLGIFIGIGTIASLLSNGIMVGSFQYYFVDRGLLFESAVTIWLHGTLEISSIILAGGAGLALGRGLVFPGTYTRLQSLQISGVRSLKLMLGISPIFVLAAIIESFLTRYTEAPTFLKISLIVLSAALIIGYFIIYPWLKSRSGFQSPLKETHLQSSVSESFSFNKIKNNVELIKDSFQFYSRHSANIVKWVFMVSFGVSILSFLLESDSLLLEMQRQALVTDETVWWVSLLESILHTLNTPSLLFIPINALALAIITYLVIEQINSEASKEKFTIRLKFFIQLFILSLTIYTFIYLGSFGVLLALGLFGLLLFIGFIQVAEKSDLLNAFSSGLALFGKNKNQGISLQFLLLVLSFFILMLLSAPLLYMHISILKWNITSDEMIAQKIIHFIEIFIKVFLFYLILPLTMSSLSFLYFSQKEVLSAAGLKEAIQNMKLRFSKTSKR